MKLKINFNDDLSSIVDHNKVLLYIPFINGPVKQLYDLVSKRFNIPSDIFLFSIDDGFIILPEEDIKVLNGVETLDVNIKKVQSLKRKLEINSKVGSSNSSNSNGSPSKSSRLKRVKKDIVQSKSRNNVKDNNNNSKKNHDTDDTSSSSSNSSDNSDSGSESESNSSNSDNEKNNNNNNSNNKHKKIIINKKNIKGLVIKKKQATKESSSSSSDEESESESESESERSEMNRSQSDGESSSSSESSSESSSSSSSSSEDEKEGEREDKKVEKSKQSNNNSNNNSQSTQIQPILNKTPERKQRNFTAATDVLTNNSYFIHYNDYFKEDVEAKDYSGFSTITQFPTVGDRIAFQKHIYVDYSLKISDFIEGIVEHINDDIVYIRVCDEHKDLAMMEDEIFNDNGQLEIAFHLLLNPKLIEKGNNNINTQESVNVDGGSSDKTEIEEEIDFDLDVNNNNEQQQQQPTNNNSNNNNKTNNKTIDTNQFQCISPDKPQPKVNGKKNRSGGGGGVGLLSRVVRNLKQQKEKDQQQKENVTADDSK
ncbi:hypothetical protein PPL_04624 [Heterostelium album PN500]|uniref:Coilin N-terminal domain-containing protein n=1 Tax=Heterostelium pallidum (strain ATCC 26659 / Pp 5 / PN500) TaxID=670386 RepID=D3B833_HETP5|nr:hypothetical protein PPL_04624 [Heterostelium album PN500]EFA82201.1 hypothetical protein PPL_04624 [Heterostelium album PN500]|eukprot:XP_020434318.1 hypothetical protein PPL_04624 [Heterostelium album PN500]